MQASLGDTAAVAGNFINCLPGNLIIRGMGRKKINLCFRAIISSPGNYCTGEIFTRNGEPILI